MKRGLLTKIFTFEAAHFLPEYKGKCKNLHGHTYTLEVTVEGPISGETGMVIDFKKLKEVVEKEVIDKLDHTLLNESTGLYNPTCEFLALWIWDKLEKKISELNPNIDLYSIKIWETKDSYFTYYGE
ncbi:MAG: 6-carboxytetrahydropterin synthase QueD [Candidatus Heimdallarchaeaceae archaeon]